ncbi:MAG: hypothetical protein NT040_06225 [Bacteroidetes bacterium]|nr:hypothetical protein [Bacteroidota bacterium]
MNTEIIKDEIKWLLEAINEQYDAIHLHGGKIPQIEFDILMENVRKFYETMHLLQRLNDPIVYPEKRANTHSAFQRMPGTAAESRGTARPPAPEPPKQPAEATSGVKVRFSEPEPVAQKPEVPDEGSIAAFHPGAVQFKPAGPASVRQETAPASKKSMKPQEIDLFAAEEPAFSIKLKEAREKTLGPKIPSDRIENLKTAISINEKFMYINELFDGNLREYNETIETLNGFKTLDQAADFLDLMRKKNFWNTGSNAFKKLKDLVERRF